MTVEFGKPIIQQLKEAGYIGFDNQDCECECFFEDDWCEMSFDFISTYCRPFKEDDS